MKQKIYRVGTYCEDEFVEFSTCTEPEYVARAKKLLVEGGWSEDDIEVLESSFSLNMISLNDVEYNLTVSANTEVSDADDGLQKYNVSIAVDGRCDVTVRAGSFEDAKSKASNKVCDLDFGELECIEWTAVNAENLETEEFHDFN